MLFNFNFDHRRSEQRRTKKSQLSPTLSSSSLSSSSSLTKPQQPTRPPSQSSRSLLFTLMCIKMFMQMLFTIVCLLQTWHLLSPLTIVHFATTIESANALSGQDGGSGAGSGSGGGGGGGGSEGGNVVSSTLSSSMIPFPPLNAPNNIIKLIIKTYVNDLLDDQSMNVDVLKHKLGSMNDYISTHPALHQRYLWVGSTPPENFNPDLHEIDFDRNQTRYVMRKRKRSNAAVAASAAANMLPSTAVLPEPKEQLPSEEICETKQKWEQINETHDLYDNKARVIQQEDLKQFVFSYRCAKNKGKCLGISPLYESECTERYGWMYMYYKPEGKQAQWGFVNAPHHCACRLKPKFYQPTIPTDISEKQTTSINSK